MSGYNKELKFSKKYLYVGDSTVKKKKRRHDVKSLKEGRAWNIESNMTAIKQKWMP